MHAPSTHQASHSFLARRDPRWKLVAAALIGAAILSLQTLSAAAFAFALLLALIALAGIPLRWFAARLGGIALFLLLFVLVLPISMPGETVVLGPLTLSLRGLAAAGLILCKSLAFVGLVLLVMATGPLDDYLHAARRLHLPGVLIQLLALTHRYLFVFTEELGKLRIALRVRGYRNRLSRHSYRTIGNVTGTLLVRSHERAERVSQAMRCRGFDGRYRSLREVRTRGADVLIFAIGLVVMGLLPLAIDLWLRFGLEVAP
jgi:cobalt/nickel transport system permease protein